jgi:phospholipid/cholesterol/gamma-HCH transport system permease protein
MKTAPDLTSPQNSSDDHQPEVPALPGVMERFFTEVGGISDFVRKFFRQAFNAPHEWPEIVKQGYQMGNSSLGLVGITGFIMGLVLTIQTRPTMVQFGAESMIPAMISSSLVKEIAPVITALICAGKIASRIGAELGSMKVAEQIDAMEVSATRPFKYLVVTRILACTFAIPLLVIYADALGFIGAFFALNLKGQESLALFVSAVFNSLLFSDIFPAVIKTVFFGFAIGLIGCYKGYNTENGTEGVGRSANSAVVVASLAIFIIDMIAVQLTDLLN